MKAFILRSLVLTVLAAAVLSGCAKAPSTQECTGSIPCSVATDIN